MPLARSLAIVAALLLAGCTGGDDAQPDETGTAPTQEQPMPLEELPEDTPALGEIIPAPVRATGDESSNFELTAQTRIRLDSDGSGARRAAEYLVDLLEPATGFALPVIDGGDARPGREIVLRDGKQLPEDLPEGGYALEVTAGGISLAADSADGFFSGVQTLRQQLPADIEANERVDRTWGVAGGRIVDHPRFGYRSAMLDIARHFFEPEVVKRHIDRLAQYKINHLHLHLSDDQGWRIEIEGWPKLTEIGAATEVGGGPGGYYTQEEYRDIVTYAADRGITIVPEIDMPGHTNAALISYPELNCDGSRPEPYTGTHVGFSSLCIDSERTYEFVSDVISQVAELTPGEYLHVGGDEAEVTGEADYARFFERVLPMVTEAGKRPVGWHEYGQVDLPEPAIVQYWRIESEHPDTTASAENGNSIIMSPANKSYLDMKYNDGDPWGNDWAGAVDVRAAYEWDPARFLTGVGESAVHGVETALWTELVESESDIERMMFPRLQALAEVGWTPQQDRDWESFQRRLAMQAERMDNQGIDYHPTPGVSW
ncbi:hexosaminidase [Haloechinothrix alba]|uniref:beta-N-acetylhexosaminidase n=1 Tax=Haloechinothrix alba TaxID=664784 RepID=A0A238VFE2_9PSEU|nr:beta-N-acetylhexosaminidase [Haloechinothrix alba]SNR32884.1 hexosaminidase [Haloechinothrix alba]